MILKNIKEFVKQWKNELKEQVEKLEKIPVLAIVQVGNNEASNRYVRNKIKDCEEIGIQAKLFKFKENVSFNDFINDIIIIQNQCDGIIVQLPLPPHLNPEEVKKYIEDKKDVDGFNLTSKFYPCTPYGIIKYLDYCNFNLDGKNVVVVGRSNIVGKPLAQMLTDRNATVTLCHSHTKNIFDFYQTADLIICAVGKPAFLNCYSLHMPIIDVGINFVDGKLVGDCVNTEDRDVTPVPGGVGLLTRCALLENVIYAANGID